MADRWVGHFMPSRCLEHLRPKILCSHVTGWNPNLRSSLKKLWAMCRTLLVMDKKVSLHKTMKKVATRFTDGHLLASPLLVRPRIVSLPSLNLTPGCCKTVLMLPLWSDAKTYYNVRNEAIIFEQWECWQYHGCFVEGIFQTLHLLPCTCISPLLQVEIKFFCEC